MNVDGNNKSSQAVKSQEVVPAQRGIVPTTFDELIQISKLIKAAPKFLPKGKTAYSIEELAVNIQQGLEIGLTVMQAIQGIMLVNGAASVWGDYMVGLVLASGKLKTIKEWTENTFPDKNYSAHCFVKRHGLTDGAERVFSIADAEKAGLINKTDIWKKYPKRMLSMRARSWALRDMFGDVLKGLVAVEESVNYDKKDEHSIMSEIESSGYVESCLPNESSQPLQKQDDTQEKECGGQCACSNAVQTDEQVERKGVVGLIRGKLVDSYPDENFMSTIAKLLNLEEGRGSFEQIISTLANKYDDYVEYFCKRAGGMDKRTIHVRAGANFSVFWKTFYGWLSEQNTVTTDG